MRNISESFVLPPSPEYLDFPRTDGSASTWPPNITRVVDHEGHVNYYEYLPVDHAQAIRWRVLVGEAAALKLNLPKGPNYVLRNFPDGYRIYDHNKGPHKAPRHDLYLFGPIKKRFRSINEFIPHAIWLLGDPSNDCECKYCAKKAQREITASMSNILRTTPTQSPTPSRVKIVRDKGKGKDPLSRIREPRPRDTRAYAAVQRAFKHLKPSPGVLQQPMLVERSNDLLAIYSNTSMNLRRWFREGEVVWCALDPPIPSSNGDVKSSIEFWPGVVDEVKLKVRSIPREANTAIPSSSSHPDPSQASTSTIHHDPTPEGTRGPMLENNDEPVPWIVRQSTRYKVQLLAVSHSYTIDDEQVVPYQAYVPTDELIDAMIDFPPEKLDFDRDSLARFNPCPGPTPPTFFDAVPAYATALQIASLLSSTWCLTDDYDARLSITPPSPKPTQRPLPSQTPVPPPVRPPQPAPLTLQDALQMAYDHNANVSSNHSYYRNVTSVNPEMSQAETQKTANRVLGVAPPPAQFLQKRFQGLWWGSERIWADDFIRLKVPRRTLAPRGGPNILPPSGPGKSVEEQWVGEGRDPAMLGAGTRGVFLRLDGLITVDVPNEFGSTKKEARVCGMLYELADEDWEDPNEQTTTDGVSGNPVLSSSQQSSSAGPSKGVNGASVPQPQENGDSSHPGPGMGGILPEPPTGYKFRPILAPGHEFVGAMGLISGRYYPRILTHPRIKPRVHAALSRPVEEGGVTGFDNLWALEGLSGGYFNSVDPHRYKKSRVTMMQDADREALIQLQEHAKRKMEENAMEREKNNDTSEDAMDVDDI